MVSYHVILSLLSVWCFDGDVRAQSIQIPQAELKAVTDALFLSDTNGAKDGQVRLNLQQRTNLNSRQDQASSKLFSHVDSSLLRQPSFAALQALYPHFNAQTGSKESRSSSKDLAIDHFLTAISRTKIFKILREFLGKKGYQPAQSESKFLDALKQLWFGEYSRAKGVKDTSGFEHVFMGEVKNEELVGLHSWVRVYTLEQQGQLDYAGYVTSRQGIVSAQLNNNGNWKPGATFFLGSSPEYDLAIFTLCFLTNPGKKTCSFTLLDDCSQIQITSFDMKQQGQTFIGTAYPNIGKKAQSCQPSKLDSIYTTKSCAKSVISVIFVCFLAIFPLRL